MLPLNQKSVVAQPKLLAAIPLRKIRGVSVKRNFKIETKEFWISKGYDSVPKDVKEYCEYWTKWQGTDEHAYVGSDDPCHAGEDVGLHPLIYVHDKYPDVLPMEEVNKEFDQLKVLHQTKKE